MFRPLFGYVIVLPRRISAKGGSALGRSLWLILIVSFCLSSVAGAETLILQSGQEITGQIIERTDLRITVDVKGVPQTYFLGEIASIDGMKVGTLQAKNVAAVQTKEKKTNVPPRNQKIKARRGKGPTFNVSKIDAILKDMQSMMDKMANMNKNVIFTPDGGVIVVSPEKIVKYDKNLNVVKEIDLKTDHTVRSK